MTDVVQSSPDLKLSRIPEVGTAPIGSTAEIRLAELWESAPGWRGWLSTVDHKEIGLRYLVTAFIFLLMGGVEALIMRLQLARPDQTLLTPEQYNQLFTMHGVTMIFSVLAAGTVGIFQLFMAADARFSGYGFPAS